MTITPTLFFLNIFFSCVYSQFVFPPNWGGNSHFLLSITVPFNPSVCKESKQGTAGDFRHEKCYKDGTLELAGSAAGFLRLILRIYILGQLLSFGASN
jgi:hypothetical protein